MGGPASSSSHETPGSCVSCRVHGQGCGLAGSIGPSNHLTAVGLATQCQGRAEVPHRVSISMDRADHALLRGNVCTIGTARIRLRIANAGGASNRRCRARRHMSTAASVGTRHGQCCENNHHPESHTHECVLCRVTHPCSRERPALSEPRRRNARLCPTFHLGLSLYVSSAPSTHAACLGG
jgi:hypothetical protein